MSVCALMMVRDEADVIEATICHLREQIDGFLVLDHGSTDGTYDILRGLGITPLKGERGYYQSKFMTGMAERARGQGYDWVLPCDADELWYAPEGTISDWLSEQESLIVAADLYDHVATADDPPGHPFVALGYRRTETVVLPKIACRALPGVVIEAGNHNARYPKENVQGQNGLLVHHFPYRSVEQMVRKVRNGAAAYAATNLPLSTGAHWRQYGDLLEANGEAAIEEIFTTWFYSADPSSDQSLVYDPAPVSG